jgi:hypothetical protein
VLEVVPAVPLLDRVGITVEPRENETCRIHEAAL